mmetsp:Transcript_29942/g.75439  ORF Transcript_29942/g.75439 Transcript_29942/m.75439 type:complete len:132 (-) Transcript_29942:343-738(-)
MGNAACECEGNKENEVAGVRPPPEDMVQAEGAAAVLEEKASDQLSGGLANELQRLRGMWKTEMDGQTMGLIEGSEVVWDSLFNHQRSPLKVVAGRRIEMELMGQVHQAEIIDGEPLKLKWSDGEIWVRISR